MEDIKKNIAQNLLQIKAIKLKPANPFTWASGWKSPIYCDNRKTLSYPAVRSLIRDSFCRVIKEHFSDPVDVIAGVATGAIAHGALVAQELNLPFVYVRSKPKDHGMENLVEGEVQPGQSVLVIEDLISTGSSSLKVVEALRNAGCNVAGMAAIFSYGFQVAEDSFSKAGCIVYTLSDYNTLIEMAIESNYILPEQLDTLKKWRTDPANWKG